MSEQNDKALRRKEDRPQEILEAAHRIFVRDGYAGSTMAAIAKEAGAAKGTPYRYFEGKKEIFEALVKQIVAPVAQNAFRQIAQKPLGPWEMLTFIVTRPYAEMVDDRSRRAIFRILIAEAEQFPELAAIYYEESISRVQNVLGDIIEAGIESGDFRPDLSKDHLRPMVAPVVMASVWRMVFEKVEPLNLEKFAAAHLDLLYHSIRAEGSPLTPPSPSFSFSKIKEPDKSP